MLFRSPWSNCTYLCADVNLGIMDWERLKLCNISRHSSHLSVVVLAVHRLYETLMIIGLMWSKKTSLITTPKHLGAQIFRWTLRYTPHFQSTFQMKWAVGRIRSSFQMRCTLRSDIPPNWNCQWQQVNYWLINVWSESPFKTVIFITALHCVQLYMLSFGVELLDR